MSSELMSLFSKFDRIVRHMRNHIKLLSLVPNFDLVVRPTPNRIKLLLSSVPPLVRLGHVSLARFGCYQSRESAQS